MPRQTPPLSPSRTICVELNSLLYLQSISQLQSVTPNRRSHSNRADAFIGRPLPSIHLPSRERMPTKPKLGQNFLNDAQAVERIVAALGDLSGRTVVEIGPGAGAITGALAARAGRVSPSNSTTTSPSTCARNFSPDKVTVVEQDVLNFDFAAASAAAGERLPVSGNLPYYITSPILLKLAASHAALDRAVLMVQREVADRITAGPARATTACSPSPSRCTAPPSRSSRSRPMPSRRRPTCTPPSSAGGLLPRFAELGVEEAGFLRFVRQAFAQKRKTLANNLRAAGFPPAAAAAAMAQAAIDPQARAEALSIESLAALYKILESARPES